MTRKHRIVSVPAWSARQQPQILPPSGSSPLECIRESGLVGMGGAGFPTWRKLSTTEHVDVVIANAAECEPLLAHNIARLETDAERVLSGLAIAMRIVGAPRGVVAIKAKNAEAIRALRQTLASGNDDISIAFLQDRYPAGDERAIVRDVLGTLLDASQIPLAAGAVVLNVETLMRIHEAVVEHRRVTTKDITVAGNITGSGFDSDTSLVLYDVPIGLTIREILGALGITPHEDEPGDLQLILGGPYMGTPTELDSPITATSGGIMIAGREIQDSGPLGIIVCACGASEERLRSVVAAKGASIAGVEMCKNVVRLPNGRLKCRNPGICPGQAAPVLALRKQGATGILISHCTDCTNTVMQIAPKLGMRVHHITDAYMRAGDEHLIRTFRKTQSTSGATPTGVGATSTATTSTAR